MNRINEQRQAASGRRRPESFPEDCSRPSVTRGGLSVLAAGIPPRPSAQFPNPWVGSSSLPRPTTYVPDPNHVAGITDAADSHSAAPRRLAVTPNTGGRHVDAPIYPARHVANSREPRRGGGPGHHLKAEMIGGGVVRTRSQGAQRRVMGLSAIPYSATCGDEHHSVVFGGPDRLPETQRATLGLGSRSKTSRRAATHGPALGGESNEGSQLAQQVGILPADPSSLHPVPRITAARSVSMSGSIYSDTAKPTPPAPQTSQDGTDVATGAVGSPADGQRTHGQSLNRLSDLDTGRCQPATESSGGGLVMSPTRAACGPARRPSRARAA